MASNYTPHLGLCQWEPEDSFIRSEFNTDNARIDTALAATDYKANLALSGMETNSHHIYNLILRSYYESKQTGYKKALLFDGFLNTSNLSTRDDCLAWSKKGIQLGKTGQSDINMGTAANYGGGLTATRSMSISAPGLCTGITVPCYYNDYKTNEVSFTYSVLIGGVTMRNCSHKITLPGKPQAINYTLPLTTPLEVLTGDVISFQVTLGYNMYFYPYANGATNIGGTIHITPKAGSTGVLTARAQPLPKAQALLGWVRHSAGGSVSLALGEHTLQTVETRPSANLANASCQESVYRLDDLSLPAGSYAPKLTLTRNEDTALFHLYDYGLMVL